MLYDQRFVKLALLEACGKDNLLKDDIEKEKLAFVEEMFKFRTNNDADRMDKFLNYVHDIIDEVKNLNLVNQAKKQSVLSRGH